MDNSFPIAESREPDTSLIVQMPPILLRPKDAARVLAICERTLWELFQAGEIPAVNVGSGNERRTLWYLPADLFAWAERRRITRKPAGAE